MKKVFRTMLCVSFLFIGLNTYAQELDDIVKEVSESIELDELQTKALETQMERFTISLQLIFNKYEEAEPDPQAMLTDIKHAREAYQKALKADIGKEKYKAYEAFVDQPMNVRNKLKIANSLKATKKTMEKETAQILTPEQIKKWDEFIEAAKESNSTAE